MAGGADDGTGGGRVQQFDYFAETCTWNSVVLQIFTDDMLDRMETYLTRLGT